jgi:biotin carboxylase
VVVEEPDVIRKRDLATLVADYPAVSSLLACPYQDRIELRRLLQSEPGLRRIRAVVPGVEYAVGPASVVATSLGLPGAGLLAGVVLRDKYGQRLLGADAGLRNPEFRLVSSPGDVEEFMVGRGPCVLKPTARQASLGVQVLSSPAEVAEAWRRSAALDEGAAAPDRGVESQLMVERAVTGPEFSVEMLVAAGTPCFANVTAKEVLGGRYPIECGHAVPAPVTGALTGGLVEATTRFARAASFDWGVLHAEWIVDGEGWVLVECAGRLPGDEICGLIDAAYEFRFVESYLRCMLGEHPSCPDRASRAAAIRFLAAGEGRVVAVGGVEAARAHPGVADVSVEVGPGDSVRALRSSWDRIGHVIGLAGDPEAARRVAREACDLVTVTVADPAPALAGPAARF